jgi:hypothetical protein
MNKKALTEADIRTKFITPALVGANGDKWDLMTQVREEVYFTKGRVIVRGKSVRRGVARRADYILDYKPNIPLALIEAKDNHHAVGDGMPQALDCAEMLDIPFVYSSNGDAFLEHDRTVTSGPVTREIPLDQFPSPEELWTRYCQAKGLTGSQALVATQDYFDDGSGKTPRYYQLIAINRTVEAIARGLGRILLVMATGHGQDLHRLPDHLAAVEVRRQETHPLPGGSQHPGRPDQDQRLQALRPGLTKITNRTGGQGVRDLPLPLSGGHRHRGGAEHLQAVLPGLLRSGLRGRVSPGQCRGRCRLAQGARLLLRGHPDRHDGHPQGNQGRLQHRLLRRAPLQLLLAAGHRGRLSGAL